MKIFSDYLIDNLANSGAPVLTGYELGLIILNILNEGIHTPAGTQGSIYSLDLESFSKKKFSYALDKIVHPVLSPNYEIRSATPIDFSFNPDILPQTIPELISKIIHELRGIVPQDVDFQRPGSFRYNVYKNLYAKDCSESDVACIVDPSAYVSHLSAMYQYGLTNRIPNRLFITIAGRKMWDEHFLGEIKKRYQPLETLGIEVKRINIPNTLRGTPVNIFASDKLEISPPRTIDGYRRVCSVGRCFLDMLRQPDLCGGIPHVVESISENFSYFGEDMIKEIDRFGTGADKIRAGYILENILNTYHPILDKWVKYAKPGGSRKLNPSKPYNRNNINEKWMLSFNE